MMYYPLSGYLFDSYDLYGIWRIKVKKITGLYQFLARKGEIYQTWPDSDGDESFLNQSDYYYEGRDIIIFCYLIADTFDSFETLLKSFKHRVELKTPHTLVVPYSSTIFTLLYAKGSDVDMLTPKTKTNKCIGEFWVQFREPTPEKG